MTTKKVSGFPTTYAVTPLTGPTQNERQIIAQDFVQEQARDLYYRQVSSSVGLLGSAYNCDRIGF